MLSTPNHAERKIAPWQRFLLYLVVGVPILFTNSAAVYLGEVLLGLGAAATFWLTWHVNTFTAFLLHHHITFNDLRLVRGITWWRACWLFHASSLVTGATYWISSTLLAQQFAMAFQWAALSGLVIANIVGFSLRLRLIYGERDDFEINESGQSAIEKPASQ